MNDQQPIPTPRISSIIERRQKVGLAPWSDLELEALALESELAQWKTLATLAMEFVHNGPVKLYREFKELKATTQ